MPHSSKQYTRTSQLTILVGVGCFAFGMFYWLLAEGRPWEGIVGGLIAFFVSLMVAAVFNMEVKPPSNGNGSYRKSPSFDGDEARIVYPVPKDDPQIDYRYEIPKPPPRTQEIPWTPPPTPPPDAHKAKDPFEP